MVRDEFGDEDLEPEELEPDEVEPDEVETSDGAWEEERRATGGERRRWLLLLIIPVVALVVVQLRPGPRAVPTPTRSSAATWSSWPRPSPPRAGPPMVSQLRQPFLGGNPGWSLFARTRSGVVRVQLPGGRVTTTPLPRIRSGGPVFFLATRTGVMVRPLDDVPGYAVPDNESAEELTGALAGGGPVLPGPDLRHVWKETDDSQHGTIDLVGSDGRPAGPRIAQPVGDAGWIEPDGGGYPMVGTDVGVYDLRPDSRRRITTGHVAAAGPTGWLAVECEAPQRCSWVVVDRPEGRSPVRGADRHPLPGRVLPHATGVMAPDGSAAVLLNWRQDHPRAWLLDFRSGTLHALDAAPDLLLGTHSTVAWTPDSQWVVLVDERGQVVALDARTRKVRHLDLHGADVLQIAVRPGG